MGFDIYNGSETERYLLGTKGDKTLIVIGINPSTANKDVSDRTIARVMGHIERYGYDSFVMINIYPLRATDFDNLPNEFDENLGHTLLIHYTYA